MSYSIDLEILPPAGQPQGRPADRRQGVLRTDPLPLRNLLYVLLIVIVCAGRVSAAGTANALTRTTTERRVPPPLVDNAATPLVWNHKSLGDNVLGFFCRGR